MSTAKRTFPVLRVLEGYVILSHLFYFPDFLAHRSKLAPPFSILAKADPPTLRASKSKNDRKEIRKYSSKRKNEFKFVRGLGRITDGFTASWILKQVKAPISHLGHFLYFIDPFWRIRLEKPQLLADSLHTRSKLRVHVFPYGICNVLLCVYFSSPQGFETTDFIHFLQHLSSHNQRKRALFRVHPSLNAELVDTRELVNAVVTSLAGQLFQKAPSPWIDVGQSRIVYLYRTLPELEESQHFKEMAGIATLSPQWKLFKEEHAQKVAKSDLGLREGDWGVLRRWQIVLYTPTVGRRERRRLFLWKIAAAAELAQIHGFLYKYFCDKLAQDQHQILRAENEGLEWLKNFIKLNFIDTRLVGFWRDLQQFSRDSLPSYQRKVYARVSAEAKVGENRQQFKENLAAFIEKAEKWEPGILTVLNSLREVLSAFSKS